MIRAVVFDVGETLVDETEIFGAWADWLGVPRHTFSALFGALLARGHDYTAAFRAVRPGFDLAAEEAERARAGLRRGITHDDLYPDARPVLAALKEAGLWVGVAGNQPVHAAEELAALALPVDFIGVSDVWGVSKPHPGFFERVIEAAPVPAPEVLYVGDRVERDVIPAHAAGLRAALVRRGPWGFINEGDGGADVRIEGLDELPPWIAEANAAEADAAGR